MKKTYSILMLAGALAWAATRILRNTHLMDNAILQRLLWVAPNFCAVWVGVGLTFLLYPRIFKNEFDAKHTVPLVGGLFGVILLSEIIHHVFLDSAFDIWDMVASAVASVIVLLVHALHKDKSQHKKVRYIKG